MPNIIHSMFLNPAGKIASIIGTALPTSSNFFINYGITLATASLRAETVHNALQAYMIASVYALLTRVLCAAVIVQALAIQVHTQITACATSQQFRGVLPGFYYLIVLSLTIATFCAALPLHVPAHGHSEWLPGPCCRVAVYCCVAMGNDHPQLQADATPHRAI